MLTISEEMKMTPDFQKAATKAYETMITHRITAAPVQPLQIIGAMHNVVVVSFTEVSDIIRMERNEILSIMGCKCQDAITSAQSRNGKHQYVIAYNQQLPFYMLQRGLARELGHIILGHDASMPEDVRCAEAQCYAAHLLCPRPMIRSITDSGTPVTVEMVGTLTGCYGRCLAEMRKMPGTAVPAELNRQIREQFSDYVNNFLNYLSVAGNEDESPVADFGSFMEGYME